MPTFKVVTKGGRKREEKEGNALRTPNYFSMQTMTDRDSQVLKGRTVPGPPFGKKATPACYIYYIHLMQSSSSSLLFHRSPQNIMAASHGHIQITIGTRRSRRRCGSVGLVLSQHFGHSKIQTTLLLAYRLCPSVRRPAGSEIYTI
eukprot:scaffold2760_cov98-Cylindrotheca_fusiformis.AAC.1